MSRYRVVSQLLRFLAEEKKYWLIPLVAVFAVLALLTIFAQASAVAPFIYTLF